MKCFLLIIGCLFFTSFSYASVEVTRSDVPTISVGSTFSNGQDIIAAATSCILISPGNRSPYFKVTSSSVGGGYIQLRTDGAYYDSGCSRRRISSRATLAVYFKTVDTPTEKYCESAEVKSFINSARSQCAANIPIDNEMSFTPSCSNESKKVTSACNYTPINNGCTGNACGGSGTGGEGGNTGGGDGGSSSGGGTSGGDGSKGEKGDTGETGKDGVDGIDGEKGTDGIDGIDGINGKDGINGTDGRDGIDGLNGRDGVNGLDGERGSSGKDGINGLNGLDAEPADLSPVLNSINSLKSFNSSQFDLATANRSALSGTLENISSLTKGLGDDIGGVAELTKGLGGNIDALKISNKDALSDIKSVTSELGVKSDKQTAYQQIIAEKMALLGDDFGIGIPELDKKAEDGNNLLANIKELTEQNSSVLTAENQAQLDKAFAQFDETQKQSNILLDIKNLTSDLNNNSDENEELKALNVKLDEINETLIVNEAQSSKRTDKLLSDLANSNAQGESRWREMRDQYKQGNDDLVDAIDGITDLITVDGDGEEKPFSTFDSIFSNGELDTLKNVIDEKNIIFSDKISNSSSLINFSTNFDGGQFHASTMNVKGIEVDTSVSKMLSISDVVRPIIIFMFSLFGLAVIFSGKGS